KVSEHPQPIPKARKIEAQRVGDAQIETRRRVLGREPRGEIAIDFNDGQTLDAVEQGLRQGALPRADLDQRILAARVDRVANSLDVAAVDKEVLAEAPARKMAACFHLQRFGERRSTPMRATRRAMPLYRMLRKCVRRGFA